jgi:hypothetical protein
MRKKKLKFVGWFSYKDIDEMFTSLGEIPALKDKPIYHEAPYDEAHKDAIIKEIVDNNYIICGDTHQSEKYNCIPVFEDGYIFLSMRSWGGLMAEAMNIIEGEDKYTYIDFYMAGTYEGKENLPKGVIDEAIFN